MLTAWYRRLNSPQDAHRSLALAGLEGVVVAGMFAFTELFLVQLLVQRLHSSDFVIGLIATLPLAAMAVIGPFVGGLIRRLGGNRSTVVRTSLLQSLALFCLIPVIVWPTSSWAIPVAIISATALGLLGAIGGPAWVSLLAGLVPPTVRGRWFVGRLRWFLASKLLLVGTFALIMHFLPAAQTPLGGLIIIAIAVGSRLTSAILNARLYEKTSSAAANHTPTGGLLSATYADLRLLITGSMGAWTLIWCLFLCGVHISAPYFAPYMLRENNLGGLGLGPMSYVAFLQISQMVRLAILPTVGNLVDRLGPLPTLRASLAMICVVPAIWGLTPSPTAIIIAEIGSGLAWCVAECAVAVMLFSCHSDPAIRGRLVALHQSFTCMIMMGCGMLGAWLLPLMPGWTGSAYRDLFLLSSALRLPGAILAFCLLPSLGLVEAAGRRRVWQALAAVPSPITVHRGLLRFLRRPEG